MSKLLAIECATDACSVALQNDGVITQKSSSEPRSNARVLLPLIEGLLAEANLPTTSLSALCVTAGPGSFTGIRIGIAITQGLAYASGLPIFTWNTLEVMAAAFFRANQNVERNVWVALDARMGEIYWSCFGWDVSKQRLIEVEALTLSSLHEFELALKKSWSVELSVGLGSGFNHINFLGEKIEQDALPQAKTMLELYPDCSEFKAPLLDPADLTPLYLRNEISWKKRKRIRQ